MCFKNLMMGDFPGGPVVEHPPSNAGCAGLIPGQGTRISHATGQLSPHATPTELVCLNKRARVPQTAEPMRSGAHATTRERKNPHTTLERSPHHN